MVKRTEDPTGFAIVDKPAGLTSHDVVAEARKSLELEKLGIQEHWTLMLPEF